MTSDFATKSFWLGADAYAPGPALQEDLDVDVAIVGAGFTGLSTAYHLHQADPGLRIAILESEVVGYGASGRNAGFSMTKIGMMHSFTATRFGKAKAREAHLYADRAVTLLKDLVAELDLDCDYEHTGFLWVATSEKYSQRLLKEIALVHRLGITGVNLIDHDGTGGPGEQPVVPRPGVVGAEHRHPQPGETVARVAGCPGRRRGADLREHPGDLGDPRQRSHPGGDPRRNRDRPEGRAGHQRVVASSSRSWPPSRCRYGPTSC